MYVQLWELLYKKDRCVRIGPRGVLIGKLLCRPLQYSYSTTPMDKEPNTLQALEPETHNLGQVVPDKPDYLVTLTTPSLPSSSSSPPASATLSMPRRHKATSLVHSVSDGIIGLKPSSLAKGKFPAVSQIISQLGTVQEREGKFFLLHQRRCINKRAWRC